MKKLFCIIFVITFLWAWTLYWRDSWWESAQKLASLWIIETRDTLEWYNLESFISRREMLKIMMNLSWKELETQCEWKFSDLSSTDWGCIYAESALKYWFISWYGDGTFRPNNNVTYAEALKMVFQARWIDPNRVWIGQPWALWYVSKWYDLWILDNTFTNYNDFAKRSFVFIVWAKALNTAPLPEENTIQDEWVDEIVSNIDSSEEFIASEWEENTENGSGLEVNVVFETISANTQQAKTYLWKWTIKNTNNQTEKIYSIELSSVWISRIPWNYLFWFEKNWVRISSKAKFVWENTTDVLFIPSITLWAGEEFQFDIIVEFHE